MATIDQADIRGSEPLNHDPSGAASDYYGEPTGDQEWSYHAIQAKFIRATTSEVEEQFAGDSEAELADVPTLGDKPLAVLIAGKGMWGLPLTSQDWLDLRKTWVDGQIQLAQHLSNRGKWLIVSDSSHMIPVERPDAIVDAVRESMRMQRAERSSLSLSVLNYRKG